MTSPITDTILSLNPDRISTYFVIKRRALTNGPLPFLRGTPGIFFELLARTWQGDLGPIVWVCGDLHLENIGVVALAGHDQDDRHPVGLVINDFDEAAIGPCGWDVLRGAVCLRLAAGNDADLQEQLLAHFYERYAAALATFARTSRLTALYGKGSEPHCGATANAPELPKPFRDAMKRVARRKHAKFLDSRTRQTKKGRSFRLGERYYPVDDGGGICQAITAALSQYADPREREALEVLDIAFRVAGTNSLGLERYAVLVAGDGPPDGCLLLDLKEARPSALAPYLSAPLPAWHSEAQRIVTAQRVMQGLEPPLLGCIDLDLPPWPSAGLGRRRRSFVVRTLNPSEDKMTVSDLRAEDLPAAAETLGICAATAHARSVGMPGLASAADLKDWAANAAWFERLRDWSSQAAREMRAMYAAYCTEYDVVAGG